MAEFLSIDLLIYFKCMAVFLVMEAQWAHGWCTYLHIEWSRFVSYPGTLHCVFYSHGASLYPGIQMGSSKFNAEDNPEMDNYCIQGGVKILVVA